MEIDSSHPTADTMSAAVSAAAASGVKEPLSHHPVVLEITDFSPAQDHQAGGGTKVLICLASEIPKHLQGNTIKVKRIWLCLLLMSMHIVREHYRLPSMTKTFLGALPLPLQLPFPLYI